MTYVKLIMLAAVIMVVVVATTTSLAQWGGQGNQYETQTFPMDQDEPMFRQKFEGGNILEITSETWGRGKGSENGISWQKEGAHVEAKINGKSFRLTGENGGLEILDNVVFLIFKDVTISVDPKVVDNHDPSFFTDGIGQRINKLMEAGLTVPRSQLSASIEGSKAILTGTLVIAMDCFTTNGQPNSGYSGKPFIQNLAAWEPKKEQ